MELNLYLWRVGLPRAKQIIIIPTVAFPLSVRPSVRPSIKDNFSYSLL